MNPTRRQVLRALAAAPLLSLKAEPAKAQNWRNALDQPRSECFGLTAEGRGRDPESLYLVETGGGAPLSFDVSNNRILCSLSRDGVMERICINTGILPLAGAAVSGGVYTAKVLVRGDPWPISVKTRDNAVRGNVEVDLLKNVIPQFSWSQGSLRIRQIAFAPVDRQQPELSPRAIFLVFLLENRGTGHVAGSIAGDETPRVASGNGKSASIAFSPLEFDLAPGDETAVSIAVTLEDSRKASDAVERKLRSRDAVEWFTDTLSILSGRYGDLKIPAAPYFAESTIRFSENCRQSMLRLNDGRFGAGFMGSDIDSRDWNWNKDTYYCVLGSSLSEPRWSAAAIPYYFEWGLPAKPTARGLARFPDGARVTQSLSLALAPLALATIYYKLTGDREYFLRYRGFLEQAKSLLDSVLTTRRGDPFLFPSMFISNGDSRGHYHTGSNVVAWYAFQGMSRLAREVFDDSALSGEWTEVASRIRNSILDICRGMGPKGRQYFEGVYEDGTYVPGHDGEESDTTLMPFYGFCAADDPDLRRHAESGFAPSNPYYAEELDGIWWYNHGGFRPATAPAWGTALASAGNEKELSARLHRFRELTDLDGSLWWWPYRYGEKDRKAVLRGNGATKCGWASAVYLLRLIHDVLGIDVDAPGGTISFRPFCPWNEFEWSNARIGRVELDIRYRRTATNVSTTIVNRTQSALNADFLLTMANGRPPMDCLVNEKRTAEWKPAPHYDRPGAAITQRIPPGGIVEVTVRG